MDCSQLAKRWCGLLIETSASTVAQVLIGLLDIVLFLFGEVEKRKSQYKRAPSCNHIRLAPPFFRAMFLSGNCSVHTPSSLDAVVLLHTLNPCSSVALHNYHRVMEDLLKSNSGAVSKHRSIKITSHGCKRLLKVCIFVNSSGSMGRCQTLHGGLACGINSQWDSQCWRPCWRHRWRHRVLLLCIPLQFSAFFPWISSCADWGDLFLLSPA